MCSRYKDVMYVKSISNFPEKKPKPKQKKETNKKQVSKNKLWSAR